ncbi:cytochrome P450 [Bacillus sp. BRMEA1]|nr:cytochrome P450 [Neobacillus endophyticus]NRD79235.1 cytochrome P450 [Neobacillus endophyticus]
METNGIIEIPQPKTFGPLGNLPQLDLQKPTQSIMKLADEYGPIFKLKFPTGTGIFISSGELVEDACDESRFDKLVNAPLKKVRSFSGDGLFTSWTKEENWRKAHNVLLPSFSQSAMKGYHSMMVDIAIQLVQKWSRLNSDESIDVPEDMTRLTLDTIGLCGFNYRFNSFYREKPHRFIKAMTRALDEAMNQSNRLGVQDKLMVKKKRQFKRDIEYMFSLVDRIIEERKSSDDYDEEDLLSRMLNSEDPETGEKLSDENIRYQIITFLIAGHETTSGLLSFTLYFLMKHPDVLAKAYEEVDRVLTGSIPTYQQVHNLQYIRMILNESLRLWPTAPLFSLYAKEDTLLAGKYPLKKRDVVNIFNLKLHRDRAAWGDDVDEFKPERFTDPKKVPHHAFKPFGNGQRACIGRQFALHESALVIGLILKHFQLVDHTNYQLEVKETLTLKPNNFKMQVRSRQNEGSIFFSENPNEKTSHISEKLESTNIHTHLTPLLVLYGSNMGTAEGIARDLALSARFKGFQSEVAPLDDYAGNLPKNGAIFIVTSSYNGNPPKNARQFVKWLKEADTESIKGIQFAVFGCGDTNWAATYQSVPNLIDQLLADKGATRLVPKGQGDASNEFEKQFETWHEQLWPMVLKRFEIELNEQSSQTEKSLSIQFVESLPLNHVHDRIIQSDDSNCTNSPVAVLPKNKLELVERAIRRFGLEENSQVILHGDQEKLTHVPLYFPIRVWDLLQFRVDLESTVTMEQLHEIAEFTLCPPHKKEMEALLEAEAYNKNIAEKGVTLLEMLEKYIACELPFVRFIEMLPPLKAN